MIRETSSNPFGIQKLPKISYIICASQRSGSNLLCEALWNTRLMGKPEEPFVFWYWAECDPERLKADFCKPWILPPAEYIKKVIKEGTTSNGVFGAKIMWSYFDIVIDKLRAFPEYNGLPVSEMFASIFPNLHYIYMTRKDKVRQAVSLAKAIQSNKWFDIESWVFEQKTEHLFTKDVDRARHHLDNACEDNLVYDFNQIAQPYKMIVEHDKAWEAYFNKYDIKPFRIVYEEFVNSYEQTALDIINYLKIPQSDKVIFHKRAMKKQSDSTNEEWTQKFNEDMAKQT